MTSAQIVTRAAAIAKFKGGLEVAGQYLNEILDEMCRTYDFDVASNNYVFNLNPSSTSIAAYPNNVAGSGPYSLPTDYLRVKKKEFMWFLDGTPYPMINCDLSEYDQQVQQQGMQSYPAIFATDTSQSPAVAIIWPPASGAYQTLLRYFCLMKPIGSANVQQTPLWNPGTVAPHLSTVVPWFPSASYLYTRLAGELMGETSDARQIQYLGDGSDDNVGLAGGILRRIMRMDDDDEGRAKRVELDQRRFRAPASRLPDTKKIWG